MKSVFDKVRNWSRRIGVAAVAAAALPGLIGLVGESATANAQPTTDGQCTSMPMTGGQDGTAPNALTRAGQVGAATGPSASDGSMAVNCAPASHG